MNTTVMATVTVAPVTVATFTVATFTTEVERDGDLPGSMAYVYLRRGQEDIIEAHCILCCGEGEVVVTDLARIAALLGTTTARLAEDCDELLREAEEDCDDGWHCPGGYRH